MKVQNTKWKNLKVIFFIIWGYVQVLPLRAEAQTRQEKYDLTWQLFKATTFLLNCFGTQDPRKKTITTDFGVCCVFFRTVDNFESEDPRKDGCRYRLRTIAGVWSGGWRRGSLSKPSARCARGSRSCRSVIPASRIPDWSRSGGDPRTRSSIHKGPLFLGNAPLVRKHQGRGAFDCRMFQFVHFPPFLTMQSPRGSHVKWEGGGRISSLRLGCKFFLCK